MYFMFNYLSCAVPGLNVYCGINFDLVFFWMLPLLVVLVANEVLDKTTNLPREVHRKIGHVASGILLLTASFYLAQIEMLVLCIGLLLSITITKSIKLKSVYEVERYTHGTLYYVVVVSVMAYFWMPDQLDLFRYGILILTVPDALAAVIGSRWGKQLPHWNKSVLGSCVFFIGTIAVTLLFTQVWWTVLLIAVILTIIEFFSQWGIDNLLLPISGGLLLLFLI